MALGYCCQDAIFLSDGGHDLCILYLQERQEEKKNASPRYCPLIRTIYWDLPSNTTELEC